MPRRHSPASTSPAANDPYRDTSEGARLVHALISHASDAVIVQDMQSGRITDLNEHAVALYGFSREEFLAFEPGWDLRTEEERASGPSLYQVATQNGETPRRPRWHRRKDGFPIPVEVSVTIVEVDGRKLLIATLRDVSDRLEGQAELEARLTEVEGLLNLSALLAQTDDPERVLDNIVEGAVRCAGASDGALFLPEGSNLVMSRVLSRGTWRANVVRVPIAVSVTGEAFRTGRTMAVESPFTDPRVALYGNGPRIDRAAPFVSAPVSAPDGRTLAVLTIHGRLDGRPFAPRDIALIEAAARHAGVAMERVRAQAALVEREAYFRTLMKQAQDAVFVIDPSSRRLVDANPRAEELLRRTVEDMMADVPFDPRIEEQRRTDPIISRLQATHAPITRNQQVLERGDGATVLAEFSASLADGPRGPLVLITARDITERARAESERERLLAETRDRAREIETLLEATAALNALEDQETIIRTVAERAAALIGAEMMSVGLWQDDRLALTRLYRDGVWEVSPYQPPPGPSIAGHVMRTGRAYRSNDLASDPLTDHETDRLLGFRSQMTVPMLGSAGAVIGGVVLYNKNDGSPFTGHDEALLGALAAQGAAALERARSRADLAATVEELQRTHGELSEARRSAEQRSVELGAMVELSSAVAAGGDLDAVFNLLAARAAEVANFDAVLLNTYEAATDMVTFQSVHHRLSRPPKMLLAQRGRTGPAAKSQVFRQLLRGFGPLVYHGGPAAGGPALIPGLDLCISVPLRYEGELLGSLCFAAVHDRAVSDDELRLFEALGRQVAMAVHGTQSVARIKKMREDAVFRLAAACEARDPETGAHLRHIQSLTTVLAQELGVPSQQVEEFALAGVLHDVGKIVVPDAILWKPGRLLQEELMIVKMHATQGEAMLAGPDFYATAREIARHHHERWDGSGYPDGRAGADIPFSARVVAVADVFDALISPRVYKRAWAPEEAAREILTHAGAHFDPQVVEAFEALWARGALTTQQPAA